MSLKLKQASKLRCRLVSHTLAIVKGVALVPLSDGPTRDLLDGDPHVHVSPFARPWLHAKACQGTVDLGSLGAAGDEDAPTLASRIVDTVDLEADLVAECVKHGCRLTCAKDDVLVVVAEVHRQGDRPSLGIEHDPPHSPACQVSHTLLPGQILENRVRPGQACARRSLSRLVDVHVAMLSSLRPPR